MTQQRYKEYAQSDKGKAARARAHARYVAKRRALNQQPKASTDAVAGLLTSWGRNEATRPKRRRQDGIDRAPDGTAQGKEGCTAKAPRCGSPDAQHRGRHNRDTRPATAPDRASRRY